MRDATYIVREQAINIIHVPQKPPFSENYFCDNMPKLKLTNRSEHQCIPYSFTKVSKISILQWHAKKSETSRGDLWKLTMPKGLFGVKKGQKWRRLERNGLIDGIIFYWALIMKVNRFAIIPRVIHWGIICSLINSLSSRSLGLNWSHKLNLITHLI